MNADMQKALVNLIDETLGEIEELKKSDRFSASEVSLGDSKSGIESKDKNGSLGKEEDKKEEEDEKKEDEEKEDDDMDKAEGKNREADPNGGHHQVAKGEMMAGDSKEGSSTGSAEGKNREADPMSKMEDRMCKMEAVMAKMEAHLSKKEDKEEDKKEDMKKSEEENKGSSEELVKSTSDRIEDLEKSLADIAKMVKEIADTPLPAKSVSYKDVQPLVKSEDASEPLNKSAVVDKLFELKKSGENVSSLDITSAELASPAELVKIANKYNIK